MSDHTSSRLKVEIVERIKSVNFLCLYCPNQIPITTTVIDFQYNPAGSHVTAFFICPNCRKKFVINIQDLGKVME